MASCMLHNHDVLKIASIASGTTQKSRVCTTPGAKVTNTARAKPRFARVSPLASRTLSLYILPMGSWAAAATFSLRKLWLSPLLIKVKSWETGPLLLPSQRSSSNNLCSSDAPSVPPTVIYPIKACGQWPAAWSLPLHVFLLPLNWCCPGWALILEPFILVGSSSLSLCSLHLHVTLQFLAQEHEVTWLFAVVAKLLSTLSTLAVPSASAIGLPCSMVCNPYATALHCTKIHWLRSIACSFAMGSCHISAKSALRANVFGLATNTCAHTDRFNP